MIFGFLNLLFNVICLVQEKDFFGVKKNSEIEVWNFERLERYHLQSVKGYLILQNDL